MRTVLLVLLGLSIPPVAAGAQDWSEEPLGTIGRHPDLALGDDGRLHLVYARCVADGAPRGIGYQLWSEGTWGPEETVYEGLVACRPSGQNRPRVAVGADGVVHVVFAEDIVRDPNPPRYARRDGSWSAAEALPAPERRVEFVDVETNGSAAMVAAMHIPREGFPETLAGAFVYTRPAGAWVMEELGANDPGKDLELVREGDRVHATWRWVLPPDGELRHWIFDGSWSDAGSLDRPDDQSLLWPSAVPGDPFAVAYVAYVGATVNGVWYLEAGGAGPTRLDETPVRDEDRRAVAVDGRVVWLGADGALRQVTRAGGWGPESVLPTAEGRADYPAMVAGSGWTHVVFQDPETKALHHLSLAPPPPPDGGVPALDGGSSPDLGPPTRDGGAGTVTSEGCGCGSAGAGPSLGWIALALLAAGRRRLRV